MYITLQLVLEYFIHKKTSVINSPEDKAISFKGQKNFNSILKKISSQVFSEDKSTFVTFIDRCDESVDHLPVLQI